MPSIKCKVLLVIILPMIVGISNIGFCQTQFNTMTSSLTNRIRSSFTQIDTGIIYQENLSPNDSQNHSIYLQEKSVLSLCVKVIQQDSQLESKIVGNVTKISVAFSPFPEDVHGYLYYILEEGEATLTFHNLDNEKEVEYQFYVDISGPLEEKNVKDILFVGCPSFFHIELKKGDKLELDVKSQDNVDSRFEINVYSLYSVTSKGHVFRIYAENNGNSLETTADLTDIYFVVTIQDENVKTVSISKKVISPIWNQFLFWPLIVIILISFISTLYSIIYKRHEIKKEASKLLLMSDYFSFLTLVLFGSSLVTYNSLILTSLSFFFLSVVIYGLSLSFQVYGIYLKRKDPILICPYCLKKIDLRISSFCCGRLIRRVSLFWYFAPAAFGIFFLNSSYSILSQFGKIVIEFASPLTISLWTGAVGCMIGGIISWWINREATERKSFFYLIIGVILTLFFPWIVDFLIAFTGISPPVIKYEIYGSLNLILRLVRVNASPSIPSGIIVAYIVFSGILSYFIQRQTRMTLVNI